MPDQIAPVGILGGTFDPVHFGHLRLAEEAADACGLAQVVLIPAAAPNLRDAPATPATHRLEMVRLATLGNARLAVDDRELRREGMSYTVDTLATLRADFGATRPICLILGADAFLRLPRWSRWLRLFELCHILVATRPGYELERQVAAHDELDSQWRLREVALPALSRRPAGGVARLEIPLLEISASDLRARMSRGVSVRYLLPPAVVDYIAVHRLYGIQ